VKNLRHISPSTSKILSPHILTDHTWLYNTTGSDTFSELATYVKMKVEKMTDGRQHPQFDNLAEEDGELILRLAY